MFRIWYPKYLVLSIKLSVIHWSLAYGTALHWTSGISLWLLHCTQLVCHKHKCIFWFRARFYLSLHLSTSGTSRFDIRDELVRACSLYLKNLQFNSLCSHLFLAYTFDIPSPCPTTMHVTRILSPVDCWINLVMQFLLSLCDLSMTLSMSLTTMWCQKLETFDNLDASNTLIVKENT